MEIKKYHIDTMWTRPIGLEGCSWVEMPDCGGNLSQIPQVEKGCRSGKNADIQKALNKKEDVQFSSLAVSHGVEVSHKERNKRTCRRLRNCQVILEQLRTD